MIIGLDVGGTNTDVVLLSKKGLIREVKVPTDSSDLFHTVLTGLERVMEQIDPQKISRVVLSTTLTTNAIIQNTIPQVGMIVSSGPGIDPEFYRTNPHYYTVSGSIDHRGREITPVNETEVKDIIERLKSDGIEHVGVIGKFSARNPNHELKIFSLMKDRFEKIFLGHQCSGNLSFPRRIATTFLKTATYPLHKRFFEAVKKSLDQKGFSVPIHILKADGGTMSFESSIDYPGQTILSGPAASVMGAIAFAPEQKDVVVLDIGGTTTDMAVLINRVPVLEPLGIEISGYKTLIRSLKTRSIGLGGDSTVRVTDVGLTIGPDRKGPAMAFGGDVPTPTDALFALGLIKTGDREKALKGIGAIAADLGVPVEVAASKIFDKCCMDILEQVQHMVDGMNSKPVYTVHELHEGYKIKPSHIMILGGPATCFAERLKKFSDLTVNAVPKWHVANAIGAALARTTCEVTLFADTEREMAIAPEENFSQRVQRDFFKKDAIDTANNLLRQKALEKGAKSPEDLEMEVLEELEFNMVRGFHTTGKNIRVKVQIKPGLIGEYAPIINKLLDEHSNIQKKKGGLISRLIG